MYSQWLTAANQPQPPKKVQTGWQKIYYTALPHRYQEYFPKRLKGNLYSSRGKKYSCERCQVGLHFLCQPSLPPPPQREKLRHGVGSMAAATRNIQRGDAQLSPVRLPVCCYQLLARLEEREVCSWLRCTSAGIKKAPGEGTERI